VSISSSLRRVRGYILAAFALLAGAGLCCIVISQPRLANHLGYALPGAHGLPFRVHYAGRDYWNPSTCAGADWCKAGGPPRCTTSVWFHTYGYWPLQRVGWLWRLFDWPISRYAVFRTPTPPGMTTMGVYVQTGADCYIAYSLEGGP
jgi:hypothetical protein